jgi:hypothetical protein
MRTKIMNVRSLFVAVLISMLGLVGCEESFTGNEFVVYEQEEPEQPVLPEIEEIGKKGMGMTFQGGDWSEKVSQTKSHWFYSWGAKTSIKEPFNIDYVPMVYGKWDTEETFETLRNQAAAGEIKYLLGFNEPDGESQANMTVEEAIALWPSLESVGVPLGSPAAVGLNSEWFIEFMRQAKDQGLRIDFICVHSYGGLGNMNGFLNKLAETYDTYGLPIWITEFGVGDWDATTVEEHKYTPAQIMTYMQEILPELEARAYIHKYAWFPSRQSFAPLSSNALWVDGTTQLTELGEFYANYKPNDIIGPGRDDVRDPNDAFANNILIDGDFENGDLNVAWTHWGADLGGGFQGDFSVRMKEKWGTGLDQTIAVEPGKTYAISFTAKWLEEAAEHAWFTGLTMAIGNGLAAPDNVVYHVTDAVDVSELDWTTINEQFTVPDGVTEVNVSFYRANKTAICLLDNVLFAPL